jgi:hypothetical protein
MRKETGFTTRAAAIGIGIGIVISAAFLALPTAASGQSASGPLRVHPTNPRYFADAQNRAVYLTGSHTWANLQDIWMDWYQPFDFEEYLDVLEENNHNFIRLWRCEMPEYQYENDDSMRSSDPHPWLRTGPGVAGDGELRFNLNQFDQEYFNRLRQRCIAAGQRGIYVSVMLFEGHGLSNTIEGWHSHPFKASNNVNGINGDPNGDDDGLETHTLASPAVTVVQEAYVRRVIDTLNDLDNILFEIANESHPGSVEWQNHFINYIWQYQITKPQQHLIWLTTTFPNIDEELWDSHADVISPGSLTDGGAYMDNPPANDGDKIIITDTDHLWGCGGNGAWVWKSFTRGLHPIYMDGWDWGGACTPSPDIRSQMGYTRSYALRMNLANCVPSTSIANTGWCLADAGDAYLVFAPNGGTITVNLSAASGSFDVEWFNPETGQASAGTDVTGGAVRTFNAPFGGQAVLFVHKPQDGDGDTNGDGEVNVDDLIQIVMDWGPCSGCEGDIDGNGSVNVDDLIVVIMNWD